METEKTTARETGVFSMLIDNDQITGSLRIDSKGRIWAVCDTLPIVMTGETEEDAIAKMGRAIRMYRAVSSE